MRGSLPVSQWLTGGSARIRSIQRGTIAIAAGATSNTATISAVDEANTRLVFLGVNSTGEGVAREVCCRVALTNATTVTATVNTTGANNRTVSYEVIEYFPGAIRSVQRGSATGATATISAVNTNKATLDFLGSTTNSGGADASESVASAVLTNATTVTVTASGTFAVGYQVVEWF
jgi:hypothetical protein